MKNFRVFNIIFLLICSTIFSSCKDDSVVQPFELFEFEYPADCCKQEIQIDVLAGNEFCSIFDEFNMEDREAKLYMPCVFSPDSYELENSLHILFIETSIEVEGVRIYAQDGTVVFNRTNYLIEDPLDTDFYDDLWDGTVRGEQVDGPFQVEYLITCADGVQLRITGLVCSLLCSNHNSSDYFNQGLNSDSLKWGSQHDGRAGFYIQADPDECFE